MTCAAVRHPLDMEVLDRATPVPMKQRAGLMARSDDHLRRVLLEATRRGCHHTAGRIREELLRRLVTGEFVK